MIRTVVLDRHLAFAGLIAGVLRATPDVDSFGYSDSPSEMLPLLHGSDVDVVLVDRDLWSRPDVGRALRHRDSARALILLDEMDPEAAVVVLREGAAGVLPKTASLDELLESLRAVHAGKRWVPASAASSVLTALLRDDDGPDEDHEKLSRLTARERDVLALLVSGVDRQELARRLFISRNTVRSHIGHILAKFGVGSVVAAIGVGVRAGLRPSDDVIDLRSRRTVHPVGEHLR